MTAGKKKGKIKIVKTRRDILAIKQRTLADSVSYTGVGLHSGRPSTVVFRPAPADSGVVFVRVDLAGRPVIPARASCVTCAVRATTLAQDDASVFTVEHLLAALFIADVDNCRVELDGPEPPAADGSALPFVRLLAKAGREEQGKDRRIFRLERSFSVHDRDRYLLAVPYEGQRFSFLSLNDHPLLGAQYLEVEAGRDDMAREIAPARTIAFVEEIERLRAMGLGLGGTSDNVIVYDREKALTPLRFADELVRHKLLDLLGDIFLAGRFYGHVVAVKSGHALNTRLAADIERNFTRH
jgi:UDP-3-O-acyl N-acetylglucosamine deacetylase